MSKASSRPPDTYIDVPVGSLAAHYERIQKMTSPDTPAIERAAMRWDDLARALNAEGMLRNVIFVRHTLWFVAWEIIAAGLRERVQKLGNADITGRDLAIPMLQRAVRIAAEHPDLFNADEGLGRFIAAVMEVSSRSASAARRTLAVTLRKEVLEPELSDTSPEERAEATNALPTGEVPEGGEASGTDERQLQYVTADQIAAIVNRSKRTLEKHAAREKNPLPDPDISGGGGKPNEWLWASVRPWLEAEYGRKLPLVYPGMRS